MSDSVVAAPDSANVKKEGDDVTQEIHAASTVNISLLDITSGENERGIPFAKFIDDVGAFAGSFTPPVSAELLIGAFTELFSKFKSFETSLTRKEQSCKEKIPEIEKSLALVRSLKKKHDEGEAVVARYNLADHVYGKAELDMSEGIVNLWLGANVMLEYTYDDAIALLESKEEVVKREYKETKEDLAFTRDQIITSEVNMSRIYNWDVRRKREQREAEEAEEKAKNK